jgi:hypothetical protein
MSKLNPKINNCRCSTYIPPQQLQWKNKHRLQRSCGKLNFVDQQSKDFGQKEIRFTSGNHRDSSKNCKVEDADEAF